MNLANLKIAARLALLGGLFVLALAVVGFSGTAALGKVNAENELGLRQVATLSDAIDSARGAQVQFKIQVQEWKNILIRGHDPAQLDKHKDAFQKRAAGTRAQLEHTGALLGKLGLQTPLIADAIQAHDELGKNYLSALAQYDSADPASYKKVDALVKGMDRAPTARIDEIVAFMQKQSTRFAQSTVASSAAVKRDAVNLMLVTIAITVLVCGAVMVWLARSITAPLNEAVSIARTVAAGDLSSEIEVRGTDEIGMLLGSLKQMHDNLAAIVGKVRLGTEAIASASSEIAQGNLHLSNRTEEQASSLEETASAMEELTSTVRQTSVNADQASSLANEASSVAVRGGDAVGDMIKTMGAINDSSRKIVDIISVIDGIAFQTNILALNAAVEAARAGEQGRGFAVVATEVRNLAQRSAAAAKEIKHLIVDSVSQVEAGSKLVEQAGSTMEDVVSSVHRVNGIIGQIAVASNEQNAGIGQINGAIAQMDAATQQNAALVEQAAAAAASMQQQAEELKQAVSVFKIHERFAPAGVAVARARGQSNALRLA